MTEVVEYADGDYVLEGKMIYDDAVKSAKLEKSNETSKPRLQQCRRTC